MVDGERRLVAIDRLGPLGQHEAGVVDQHVEPGRLLQDLRCSLPHRGQVGQVEDDELHAALTVETLRDRRHRGPPLVGVAGRQMHPGAHGRQGGGRLEPDARSSHR